MDLVKGPLTYIFPFVKLSKTITDFEPNGIGKGRGIEIINFKLQIASR